MKKLLSMAALAVLSFANAQKWDQGIKLGYVNSTIQAKDGVHTHNFNPMSNIYLTSFYEYKFNKFLSAQAELGIAGLGATNFPNNSGELGKLNVALVYIPIGVKFYPIENKLSVGAGLNLGFNVGVYGRERGERIKYDNFNTGNHSYYAGLEYKITNRILAEFKYARGLSKLIEQDGIGMKNNFFQVGVGYGIGL